MKLLKSDEEVYKQNDYNTIQIYNQLIEDSEIKEACKKRKERNNVEVDLRIAIVNYIIRDLFDTVKEWIILRVPVIRLFGFGSFYIKHYKGVVEKINKDIATGKLDIDISTEDGVKEKRRIIRNIVYSNTVKNESKEFKLKFRKFDDFLKDNTEKKADK